MTKNQIIEAVAQEYVDGVNERKKIKVAQQKADIDTLFNFGDLWLLTPKQLVTAFYNSIVKLQKKKK